MIREGNTKDFKPEDIKLKVCVYGGPGTGKTWFACSMPKPFLVFHNTLEDGLLYFKMRKIDIDFAGFDDIADLNNILTGIENGSRANGAKSIIIDGFGKIGDPLIEAIRSENGGKTMTQPMWGTARDRLKNLVNRILNLGKFYHICITVGDMLEKNDLNGNVYGLPNIIGRFREEVGGLFDLFLYSVQESYWDAGVRKARYVMQSKQYLDFRAKDRTNVLDFAEPNDFSVIYNKFTSAVTEVTEAIANGTIGKLTSIPPAFRAMIHIPQALPEEIAPDQTEPVVEVK